MKNVKLLPALIAIFLTLGCNRNPEEQKSKAIIEDKPETLVEEKPKIIKEEKSNSYAFSPKSEMDKISEVKHNPKNRQPITKKIKQLPKSELNLEKTEAEISGNIYDIFKSFEKPFQTFTFLPQKDTVLIGLEGTTLKINANSFVNEITNKPVSGPIKLKLREYYSISDMLLSNLSTKSGNELLETGGMVYLEVYSGNEKLKLNKGQQIEIGFPYQTKKDGMQLFNGEWRNDNIDWSLDKSVSVVKTEEIFQFVEVSPRFPGGERELMSYLRTQIKYPTKAKKDNTEGLVVISFVIQKDGTVEDLQILKSVSKEIDEEAIRVIKLMPNWVPGRSNGKEVSVRYNLPVRFSIDSGISGISNISSNKKNNEGERFIERFEKRNKDAFRSSDLKTVSRYMLLTSDLGWINCDAFYGAKSRVNFSILPKSNSQENIKLVFHKFRSIYPGILKGNKVLFNNIPKDEKITIIGLKKDGNKILLAIQETVTSKKTGIDLYYEEITMEMLKDEMLKLNKL